MKDPNEEKDIKEIKTPDVETPEEVKLTAKQKLQKHFQEQVDKRVAEVLTGFFTETETDKQNTPELEKVQTPQIIKELTFQEKMQELINAESKKDGKDV